MRRIRPSSVEPDAAVNPNRARVSITMPVAVAACFFARCCTRSARTTSAGSQRWALAVGTTSAIARRM